MDTAILHNRLAAAEAAIIKTDERLDALEGDGRPTEQAELLAAATARIITLEESLTECLAKLESLEATITQTEETTVAEALEAVADGEEAIAAAIVETSSEPPEETEETILELEPESPEEESESEGDLEKPAKSSRWWENLLVLR